MTAAEIRSLPATIDLVTAGRVFGVGRTKAYQLARTGEFPCRVLRVGQSYRVSTADLLAVLGLTPHPSGQTSAHGQSQKPEKD
ncbi:helix-turn-helix domain-containing protein [Actinomadura chibensis]|uniref:Helix-turn-helix domain-containing protein n=1 Tax=Actinomadura chibensis TaxID=392828 RepID=A0A5D0N998_9ACTN|nr:helix-turn-helix domain-containing protein [Actinomadura chibensis]